MCTETGINQGAIVTLELARSSRLSDVTVVAPTHTQRDIGPHDAGAKVMMMKKENLGGQMEMGGGVDFDGVGSHGEIVTLSRPTHHQSMETRSSTLPRRSSFTESLKNGGSNSNGSRPVSFYDNFRENGGATNGAAACHNSLDKNKSKSLQNNSASKEIKFKYDNPTQVICLNTTVPQNIAVSNIAGRHTPTRNSLRHSRMIVMNRMGKVPKKSLPPIIRFHKLAKALVGLQVVLGTALCLLSLWLLVWAPRLKTRDNPYWSGFPLLLSGIVGLIVLCSCRKEYPGMSKGYCTYSAKVISIFLSTVAAITCLTACTFAIIHLLCLSSMECDAPVEFNGSCYCKITSKSSFALVKTYHYLDLQCTEVRNVLTMLLTFSSVANSIGGLLSVWYIYLYWSSRYMYTYSKVRTKDNTPMIISNS